MRIDLFYMDGCPACEAIKPEWAKLEASKLVPTSKYEVRRAPRKSWPPSDGPVDTVPAIVIQKNGRATRYRGPRTAAAILEAAYAL